MASLILEPSLPIKIRLFIVLSLSIFPARALKSDFFDDPPSIKIFGLLNASIGASVVSGVGENELF